jgi:hypothetical protein
MQFALQDKSHRAGNFQYDKAYFFRWAAEQSAAILLYTAAISAKRSSRGSANSGSAGDPVFGVSDAPIFTRAFVTRIDRPAIR